MARADRGQRPSASPPLVAYARAMPGTELETIARLADPASWSVAAASLLADLGFSLINSDRPSAPGGAHLLVALRAEPALHHFDPEVVTYWAPAEPHALQVTLDRTVLTRAPWATDRRPEPVLWGHVHVTDRLGVENRFLTFGGELRAAVVDGGLTVLDLATPAPIVRWGGHSQATDPLATEVGAFFGRLIVPVDYVGGAERRLFEAEPSAIYAAFLAWADTRLDRIAATTGSRSDLEAWIDREEARLRTGAPDLLRRGAALLESMGLAR